MIISAGRLNSGNFLGALLITLVLSAAPNPAHAGFCADILSRTKTYWSEVRQTRGLRLLIKNAGNRPPEPFYGFVSRSAHNSATAPMWTWLTLKPLRLKAGEWIQKGEPGWKLSPLNGLQTALIDRPTDWVVRRFTGPDKQAALVGKLPAIVGWALLTQIYVIDPVTDAIYEDRIVSEVENNRSLFDDLIQNDYRLKPFARTWPRGYSRVRRPNGKPTWSAAPTPVITTTEMVRKVLSHRKKISRSWITISSPTSSP
ncbi:MAG: hypothetical protein HC902_08580 [Calothrix sp. SM1_5_4]|nr:hypothetical protein [Calothrix sp. SM1_5_4]